MAASKRARVEEEEDLDKLWGAERVWAGLTGSLADITEADRALISKSCADKSVFKCRDAEWLEGLSVKGLRTLAECVFDTQIKHMLKRQEKPFKGVEEAMKAIPSLMSAQKQVLLDALRVLLLQNLEPAGPIKVSVSSKHDSRLPWNRRFTDHMRSITTSASSLTLLDVSFLVFTSYHAPGRLNATNDERLAIFITMITMILNNLTPTHLAVCFDSGSDLIKCKRVDTYKANRPNLDEALFAHFDACTKFCTDTLRLTAFKVSGYEADDVINSLKIKWLASDPGNQVVIVTSDKDFCQICSPRVSLIKYDAQKRQYDLIRPADVERLFGVRPDQFVDLQCLYGDPSDGIQGLVGVGRHTAAQLLKRHGSLERVFQYASSIGDQTVLSQQQHILHENRYLLSLLSPEVPLDRPEMLVFSVGTFKQNFNDYLENKETPPRVREELLKRKTMMMQQA